MLFHGFDCMLVVLLHSYRQTEDSVRLLYSTLSHISLDLILIVESVVIRS